ncbi:MAG TPA: DUF5682 family protein [Myxococcota bacterium]|nr:DUF5682 family protein [Myxococcota bacterium]
MSPIVLGVRHHSPACARVVQDVIRRQSPAFVLIEGPVDYNERIDELLLGHQLPVAVFSFMHSAARSHASWSPLCDYSPEYVALRAGREQGAELRFMDLPVWAERFQLVRNRYADRRADGLDVRRLCQRLGVDGSDALWDHLFEQPDELDALRERLRLYFIELRGDHDAGIDAAREAHMARCVRWAIDQDRGPVVVVCGGWHAPALEEQWQKAEPGWPEPIEAPEQARIGSYLVPYSFKRLDSFVGYESGMPSPSWYQAVWDVGPQRAPELLLERSVKRLRGKKQVVSPADVIATWTLAQGLRQLRGHRAVARVDLLDGIAGALIKHALDRELPWSGRGRLEAGTDPVLVEVVAAFSGEGKGSLHPDTPRPPLLADVRAELENHDLVPTARVREVELDLREEAGRGASRVLHRLRLLDVPGFARKQGPRSPADPVLSERWALAHHPSTEIALIEASAFGATLVQAAAARVEALLAQSAGLDELSIALLQAVFIGIDSLAGRVLSSLRPLVEQETDLAVLGVAVSELIGLWRHDTLLLEGRHAGLKDVLEQCFDRGLWLVEGVSGSGPVDSDRLRAVVALRDLLRHGEGLDPRAAWGVMERRVGDQDAPSDLRGAALGFLWSTGAPVEDADGQAAALARGAPVECLGDVLAGLFALAREEVLHAEGLVEAIDGRVVELEDRDFLIGLPGLRLAFEFFPPREREALARRVLALRGQDPARARCLLTLQAPAKVLAFGLRLEDEVDRVLTEEGLS